MLSEDKPDRVTFFAQITSDDQSLTQSIVCDLYNRVDLQESPMQIDEQIVFNSVDKSILEDNNRTYNGVGVT